MIQKILPKSIISSLVLAALAGASGVQAAEGNKLRYPQTGTFGNDFNAPGERSGFFGSAALTRFKSDEVTGDDGNPLTLSVPVVIGAFSGSTTGAVKFSQDQTNLNLIVGYITRERYAGGKVIFGANLPLIKIERSVTISASLPVLPPALVPATALINANMQAQLAAQSKAASGEESGMGDPDIGFLWIKQDDKTRITAGVSLVLPVGDWEQGRAVNPGFGDYYTLRPTFGIAQHLMPDTLLAGRITLGLNGSNGASNYRTGNFFAFEGAIVQQFTPGIAAGLSLTHLQQIQDDKGPAVPAHGARLKNSGYGPFVTVAGPGGAFVVNLGYHRNFSSANSVPGQAFNARVTTLF